MKPLAPALFALALASSQASAEAPKRLRAVLTGHTGEVMACAFAGPDLAVSGGNDQTVGLWDLAASTATARWPGGQGSVNAVSVSPDGRWLLTGGDAGGVAVWKLSTRELENSWKHGAVVNGVLALPDGRFLTAGDDKLVRVWDARGRALQAWAGHDGGVMALSASRDGRSVLSGGRDGRLMLWDARKGRAERSWKAHEASVFAAALSADGRRAVSGGGDGFARAWDVRSGAQLFSWRGTGAIVPAAAVSADGRRALTGDDEGVIRLYDLETGAELASWKGHDGTVFSLAFSADGAAALSTGWDALVKLWSTAPSAAAPPPGAALSDEEAARVVLRRVEGRDGGRGPGRAASAAEVELGRALFFDAKLSRDGSVSCATCHRPDKAWGDGLPRSRGVGGKEGKRNSPSLLNLKYNAYLRWDGSVATLEEAALAAIQAPHEMDRDLPGLEEFLRSSYRGKFAAVYGGAQPTAASAAAALAAFVATVGRPDDSPYDRFRRGEAPLSAAALKGLALFGGKARCLRCHNSQDFADSAFHRTTMDESGGADAGRYALDRRVENVQAFRTPSLRNVAITGPYMHDGRFATLAQVVDFYDRGGDGGADTEDIAPLGLTAEEKKALIAFLESLTNPAPR